MMWIDCSMSLTQYKLFHPISFIPLKKIALQWLIDAGVFLQPSMRSRRVHFHLDWFAKSNRKDEVLFENNTIFFYYFYETGKSLVWDKKGEQFSQFLFAMFVLKRLADEKKLVCKSESESISIWEVCGSIIKE